MISVPFFANLAYTMLAYLITYGVGSLVMAMLVKPERSCNYEFKRLAFGVWLLIAGYSVWHTGGHTLSLGLIFLALFAAFHYRPELRFRPVLNISALLVQLGILLLLYILQYVQVYDPVSQTLLYYPVDLCAQATLVEKLNSTGLESTHTDFFFREPVRNLYHYGDLWYPAIFTRLFSMRAMEAVRFLYTAVGATVVMVGAFALASQVSGKEQLRRTDILLALGFIGFSAFSFYVPKTGGLDARWPEHFTLINQSKVYWVAMAALLAVIALYRDDLMGFTLSLLTVSFLYVIAAPALLTGWFFVLGYSLLTRSISWSGALRLAVPVLGTIVLLMGYVYFSDISMPGLVRGPLQAGVADAVLWDKKYVADVVYTFLYTALRVLIASWPLLLFLWIFRRDFLSSEKYIRLFCFLLAGLAGGVLAYSMIYFEPDGFQLWTVPHVCLMAIFVFLLLLRSGMPAWFKLAILGLCWYQNVWAYRDSRFFFRPFPYNEKFVSVVMDNLNPREGRDVAVILKPVRKAEDSLWASDPNQYFPFDLLKWKLREYHPYNISLLDTELQDDPAWANFQRAYKRHSSFGIFVDRKKQTGSFISIEASQRDFIRRAGIRYLLIEPGARSNELLDPLIAKSYTDELTGYRFCVLREI